MGDCDTPGLACYGPLATIGFAALRSSTGWGLCPQTPGIFVIQRKGAGFAE